jgi:hypothetical protein
MMISDGNGIHADSIPIMRTTPGYPKAEIVVTMNPESISIIRAIKLVRYLLRYCAVYFGMPKA